MKACRIRDLGSLMDEEGRRGRSRESHREGMFFQLIKCRGPSRNNLVWRLAAGGGIAYVVYPRDKKRQTDNEKTSHSSLPP